MYKMCATCCGAVAMYAPWGLALLVWDCPFWQFGCRSSVIVDQA